MSKLIAVIAGIFLLASCGSQSTETTAEPTPEPITAINESRVDLVRTESALDPVSRSLNRVELPKNAGKSIRIELARQAAEQAQEAAAQAQAEQEAQQAQQESQQAQQESSQSSQSSTTTTQSSGLNWAALRECESGGDYSINTGNGYSGAYQFSDSTWQAMGGTGSAYQASSEEQDMRAQMLYDASGPGQWPTCGPLL